MRERLPVDMPSPCPAPLKRTLHMSRESSARLLPHSQLVKFSRWLTPLCGVLIDAIGLGPCVFSPMVVFPCIRVKYRWPNAQVHALMLQKRKKKDPM